MARKHEIYWHRERREVAAAFLHHCRDRDLSDGTGIPRGSIIHGAIGFAVAEADVPNLPVPRRNFTPTAAARPIQPRLWEKFASAEDKGSGRKYFKTL